MNYRRRTLKKIGAVTIWSTPIVNSIILPAHAQTSIATLFDEVVIGTIGMRCASPGVFSLDMNIGLAKFNENGSQDPRLDGLNIELMINVSEGGAVFFSTTEDLIFNALAGNVDFEIQLDDRLDLIEIDFSVVEPQTNITVTQRARFGPSTFDLVPNQCV
ncbi:hypothetical protein [Arenicella xantha]|uniref:Uncharacterized protein n=1 Tax=Arenicella xantha TaxID=644221 RepID=A0A395JH47_9GAMM|nr:hypothetical protein [Arenicella xantha]RBP44823.1 hypothetical protein DFR28_1242 [Arenicella xantha]